MISSQSLWAKLGRDATGAIVRWHSLVDHSADVAAVVEALLVLPTLRQRLARAANVCDLDEVTNARLAALSFLHDIGKANRGFRARVDPHAPPIGHIDQVAWIFHGDERLAGPIRDRLSAVLGLERIEPWFTEAAWPLFDSLFAHHGRPWRTDRLPDGESAKLWNATERGDPIADLQPMAEALDRWFSPAFADGPPLPSAPAFQHAFAGLLMLADWLGSDEGFFPYACGACPDRMGLARR